MEQPSYRCGRCKQVKAEAEFAPSQRKTGAWCRSCHSAYYTDKAGGPITPRPCGECGQEFQPDSRRHRYCSNNCKSRASYARTHPKVGRVCQACGVDISEMRGDAKWCSEKCSASHPNRPKTRRKALLKANYGLTVEQFDVMLAGQDGTCAICATDAPGHKGWCVDHCHTSGRVRGILCTPCNTGIGQMKDDPVRLRAAADYLERN